MGTQKNEEMGKVSDSQALKQGLGMKENVVLQCERSRAWATMTTREKKGRSEGKKC